MKNNSIKKAAQRIRGKGEGGDTILAHINPMEAILLNHQFGGDINPETGLPQFGGLFRSIGRAIKKVGKKALPVIGTLIGGALGGPGGAIAGGALGGGLSSKKHPLDHALGGALLGLGHGFISPSIGQKLSLDPQSFLGRATMMNSPSIGEALGLDGFGGGALKAASASQLLGNKSGYAAGDSGTAAEASKGLFSNFGLMDTALLATSALGLLKGKEKYPAYGEPGNESMQQRMRDNKFDWGPMVPPKVKERNPVQYPPRGYRGTGWNFFPTPEEQQAQILRVNQEMAEPGYTPRYAKGGRVSGYYKGKNGGQSDKRLVALKPDSFIVNATTVSLAGDGNSDNGAHVIKNWAKSFMQGDYVRAEQDSDENVRAMVSDGELKLTPKEVAAVGKGSIDKGVKTLRKMEKNLRKHKGVQKFLPPKSKSLDAYAGIKR